MLGYNDNSVNYEILKHSNAYNLDGSEVYELIIRAEKNKNTEGIIIKNKNIDIINEIINNIKEFTFDEAIKYLNDNKIIFEKISFM